MQVEWVLSQTFSSLDAQGIRTACVVNDDDDHHDIRLVVGTQGGSLCEYHVLSGTLQPIHFQHNHAVTAVTSLRTELVTACKDSVIRYFDTKASYQCLGSLEGHSKPVTSLAWAQTQNQHYLLSGSWDGTAKVWDWQRKVVLATLDGHENSTCVVALPSSSQQQPNILHIATGSAGIAVNNMVQDYQVRIWSVNVETGLVQLLHTITGDHQGPIRDIHCCCEGDVLMTCSNDGTVVLRNVETGKATGTLVFVPQLGQQQQPPMLLSVATSSDATTCVASAEDGHVVFWSLQGNEYPPQTILHPTTVWNVLALPNGDIATCCDDGQLRIFTRATERIASATEQEAFQQIVQQAHTKSGPTSEEIAKLPKWEHQAQHRGTSEGQVQVFQKNGIAIAAQWSMASSTWIEVGQVVGSQGDDNSAGGSSSGIIDGVQYDHVLPIEVDQTGGGVAQLRVGYNIGENPFVAAQRFLDAHQLPQYHLSQIADYIQQRVGTAAPTIGTVAPPHRAATTGIPIVSFQHLPMSHAKTFDLPSATALSTLSKIQSKLQESVTDDSERTTLATLVETLGATQRYHVSHVTHGQWELLQKLIVSLPPASAFPALDLARMAVRHPDGARYDASSLVVSACQIDETAFDTLSGPAAVAIPMLTLRLAANVLAVNPTCLSVFDRELLLACARRHMRADNKNIRLSVATLLYNVVFSMQALHDNHSDQATASICASVVDIAKDILTNRQYEGESVLRTLQAVGTLALSHTNAKSLANDVYMASLVEPAASPHGDVVKAVAKEVYAALQ